MGDEVKWKQTRLTEERGRLRMLTMNRGPDCYSRSPSPRLTTSCRSAFVSVTHAVRSFHSLRATEGRRGCRGTEPETTEGARMSGKGALHR